MKPETNKEELQQKNSLEKSAGKVQGDFNWVFSLNSKAAPNYNYSGLSLSRPLLSRIIACLEVKIGSLFNIEI